MINYARFKKISPPCPVCNGVQFQPLANNDRYRMGVKTGGCLHCGLVQTWPRPTPEEMSEFYQKYYRQYYQSASTPDAKYINRYNKDRRLKYTAKLIAGHVKLFSGMRVLDVGCAEGTLLANLKEQCEGLVLTGVEPSENFSVYARESTGCITYSNIDQLKAAEKCNFDMIIVNHVLEHVDDPVAFLAELRGFLVLGGVVYIDVPDIAKYAGAECLHIAHLFHFSQRTLAAAVEKAGFWVLSTETHSPPHHPLSVLCLAEKRDRGSNVAVPCVASEKDAWDKIQRAGAETEKLLYLLKFQLRRNRVAWFFVKKLRNLYRYICLH